MAHSASACGSRKKSGTLFHKSESFHISSTPPYLLKNSDVEHPLFKRSVHTQGPPACTASFSGPSREKRRRRCILAVATEGDSTPLRSEIKL